MTTANLEQDQLSGVIEAPAPAKQGLWKATKGWIKRPFYEFYEGRLERELATWTLPTHIGFIMDGNRRFARASGYATVGQGHLKGAEKLWDVLNWCYEAGVSVVTVWSFSLDNFHRDTSEVEALLTLFEEKTRELAGHETVHEREVRVRYLGEIDRLPPSLQTAIEIAEDATKDYRRFQLNIAMAYGGREEISQAFRRYLRARVAKGDTLESVAASFEDNSIEPFLYTSGQPEPDLIFRTSGEVRLSGFLLWQSAYSEYYFSDTNWPELRKIDLLRALRSYHQRHRRMGR